MDPVLVQHNVQAVCPDCRTVTTFEHRSAQAEYGFIAKDVARTVEDAAYPRTVFFLTRCAGCGRGGMAEVAAGNSVTTGRLVSFVPTAVLNAKLPAAVPTDIANEVAEAEVCAAAGAFRAASGMLRSALEKTLKANGFTKGTLKDKIDEAAKDGVITEARKERAQKDVRVLGNDVLHDAWREVTKEEALLAHHYVQRVLEDFYDDRPTVETLLKTKGRNLGSP